MPIHVFCEGCRDFVRMKDLETIEEHEIVVGLVARRTVCKHCGNDKWEVDDYREEIEDE